MIVLGKLGTVQSVIGQEHGALQTLVFGAHKLQTRESGGSAVFQAASMIRLGKLGTGQEHGALQTLVFGAHELQTRESGGSAVF